MTVKGIGDQAWAVKAGNGLSALKGTLDLVIAAPKTTDAELEALRRRSSDASAWAGPEPRPRVAAPPL